MHGTETLSPETVDAIIGVPRAGKAGEISDLLDGIQAVERAKLSPRVAELATGPLLERLGQAVTAHGAPVARGNDLYVPVGEALVRVSLAQRDLVRL